MRWLAVRLGQALLTMLVALVALFILARLVPGDPLPSTDDDRPITPGQVARLRELYGLDQPLWRQYLGYLGSIARGDLGPSFKYTNRSVNEVIAQKLPVSLELGAWALLIALAIGLPLGVLAAVRRNSWLDYACSAVGMVGICVPVFVGGPLLALLFGITLRWVNVSGWYDWSDRLLPAFTLGLAYAAYIMRLTRGGMLEVLNQDYIRTARAKGASELRVVLRHALRGGLLPVIAFLGPATAGILTGSFVIETIFQIPGLGREFVNSITGRDDALPSALA